MITNFNNKFVIIIFILIFDSTSWTQIRGEKTCAGVHIRNDLKSFEQLKGCTIIDGPLTIALVANHTSNDYDNITFPDLKEVTEYLLFFRVQGLTTLSNLFPNLSVIRGKELVSNYALIIYEMTHLQKINLPKLTDILRGSVRIEKNPNLCYSSTINWGGICKHAFTPHFIKDNNLECNNRCPDYCRPWPWSPSDPSKLLADAQGLGGENNRSLFCWNGSVCHESCRSRDGDLMIHLPQAPDGECCSPLCAGGCYAASRPDRCVACRYVSQGDRCVEKCDSHLYEYKGRCITQEACRVTTESVHQTQCGNSMDQFIQVTNLKAIRAPNEPHGKCQSSCPPGYEEDPSDRHSCKSCDKGMCRKICTPPPGKPFMITNINSLQDVAGCNAINGSLDISIKGGKNVLHELENAFQNLEEISGYLKISRSQPILTLDFLSRLKVIEGSELDRQQYSLILIDNPNLQELFKFNQSDTNTNHKRLNIKNGKIFVHLNPKLCPHRIENLKLYAVVALWDEKDVSPHTNGDKEACDTRPLKLEFVRSSPRIAVVQFENFASQMDDPRSLLYYLVNYREVQNGTVTMFDGRDGCNNLNDVWQTIEEAPVNTSPGGGGGYQEALIMVKPATRYALYIKTLTILAGSTGALSDIIYFETAPDTPGIPRDLSSTKISNESVIVIWSPPAKPNGVIVRYTLTITERPIVEDLGSLDNCDQVAIWDKATESSTIDGHEHSTTTKAPDIKTNDESISSLPTCKSVSETDPELVVEKVTFQDIIIDIVYLRQPCPPKSGKTHKKRSIDRHNNTDKPDEASEISFDSLSNSSKVLISKPQTGILGPNLIGFDRAAGKIAVNIDVPKFQPQDKFSYTVKNLKHYTTYQVEVIACHGNNTGNNTNTLKSYSKCSIEAITQVRTEPIRENDIVSNESITFSLANETVLENIITWTKPPQPNGLVRAYRLRYRIKSNRDWTTSCVNISTYEKYGGAPLMIDHGSYVLNIQAITSYVGAGSWSGDFEFEIPQNYLVSPIVLVLLALAALLLLVIGGLSITYYYQKKHHELMYASVNPDYIQYEPDEWEVDHSKLSVGPVIGSGSFGLVYKGQLFTEKGAVQCAVKTVPKTSTAKQRSDFLREASIMKQFDTFYVVKLLGVISVTNPVYVIMEFMENGDLKAFLRRSRDKHKGENKLIVDGIYLMAAQIADGMAYLSSKKFVHRDLAARNCMVGENQVVKIGDFGLTRDIYANDYYRRDTQGCLPVRWMAPESLGDNMYTSASDVWSYGIVIWELVTFSAHPYQGWSNNEVIKRVTGGYHMPKPSNCPIKLYDIMEKCWRRHDKDRPTFIDIVEYLLPETEDKLFPNCFYRKQPRDGTPTITNNNEGDILARSIPEENTTRTEYVPLLSWPANRANGLSNGVNHIQQEPTNQ